MDKKNLEKPNGYGQITVRMQILMRIFMIDLILTAKKPKYAYHLIQTTLYILTDTL